MNTTTTHFRRCNQGCDAIEKMLDTLATSERLSWREAWSRLSTKTDAEERMKVYQTIRDSGDLSEDAGLYMIIYQAIHVADQRAKSLLESVDEMIDRVWEEQGLEDWRSGDEREADFVAEFEERCPSEWDAYFVETLESHGEYDLAESFRKSRGEFMSRYMAGFAFFHQMDESRELEGWVNELVRAVRRDVLDIPIPDVEIACMVLEGDDRPLVLVFVMPIEVVGGADDGVSGVPCFSVRLPALPTLFDVVEEFNWHVMGSGRRPAGDPRVVVRGIYRGRPVELGICQYPPDQAEPATQVDASDISIGK